MTEGAAVVPNLPVPVTPFIGRDAERAELLEVLERERLVTLCGPPGVGKTRLAVQLAATVAPAHPDGAWWVDLSPIRYPDGVVPALAGVLRVAEIPGLDLLRAVVGSLHRRGLIVVLDNCEHVVGACATVAQALLEGVEGLRILVTSRQPVGVVGEWHWPVAPLSLPTGPSVAQVASSDAGRLFCGRAMAVDAGFTLDAVTAEAVVQICHHLDGIPLAIELAAARLAVLSAPEIAARLSDRFALLGRPQPLVGGRHQTLEEAIDWSHELLSPAERSLLRRLAIFPRDASLEAVESICSGGDVAPAMLVELLAGLVAKSLVMARTASGPARYWLLETVQAYLLPRLRASGEGRELAGRAARWYLRLAETAESHLTGADQLPWLARLEADYDNLQAALGGADMVDPTGELGLRLAGALTLYWRLTGRYSEGRRWLESGLARGGPASGEARAKALWGAGFLALMLSDHSAAEARLTASLDLYREFDDVAGQARALLLLANCRLEAQGVQAALEHIDQAVAVARRARDRWCLAHALALGARARIARGELTTARELAEKGSDVARRGRDPQGLRITLYVRGEVAVIQGDHRRAEAALSESLALCRQLREPYGVRAALSGLAEAALIRGDYAAARTLLSEMIEIGPQPGWALARDLSALARVAVAEGQLDAAQRLYDQARQVTDGCLPDEAMLGLGQLAAARGDAARGRGMLEELLAKLEAGGNPIATAQTLHVLGLLERSEGNIKQAALRCARALKLRGSVGACRDAVDSLEALGGLAAAADDGQRAVRLLSAGGALRTAGDWPRSSLQETVYQGDLDRARSQLSSDAYQEARTQGEALTLHKAVTYALRSRGRRGGRPAAGWDSLTPAERDVAVLVAEGLSNPEIASRLFVSRDTVKKHVGACLAKIGVKSRVALAQEASRHRGVEWEG